jgi:hypothetical protein
MLRAFPVFLVGGVALHAIVQMVHARRLAPSREMWRFGSAAAATVVLLFFASLPAAGYIEAWRGFAANTSKHMATARSQNIGLEAMVQVVDEADVQRAGLSGRATKAAPRWVDGGLGLVVRIAAALFGFVLLVAAVRRQPPWVCALLGFAWMGFVMDVSNYYYCAMALFGLLASASPVLVLPYAALVVVWAGFGVVFQYDAAMMFSLASASLLAYSSVVLFVLGVGSRGEQASRVAATGP